MKCVSDLGPAACDVVMKQYQNCIAPLEAVTHHVPFIIDNSYPAQSDKKTQSFDAIMKLMDRRNSDGDMFCAVRTAIVSLDTQYIHKVIDVMWKSISLSKRVVTILLRQIVSTDFSARKLREFTEIFVDEMCSRFSKETRAPLFNIEASECSAFLCELAAHLDQDRLARVFNFVAQADVTYCLIPKVLPVFHTRGMTICSDSMADLFDKCVQFGIKQRNAHSSLCTSMSESGGVAVDVFEVLGQLGVVDKKDLLPGGRLHQYSVEGSGAGPIVLTAYLKGTCFCGASETVLTNDAFTNLVQAWVNQMATYLDDDSKSLQVDRNQRVAEVWHCIVLLLAPSNRCDEGVVVAPTALLTGEDDVGSSQYLGRRLSMDLQQYIVSKLVPCLSGAMLVVALDGLPIECLVPTYQKQLTNALSCFMDSYKLQDDRMKTKMVKPTVYHAARLTVGLSQNLDYFSNDFIMRTVHFWCGVLENDLDPFCRVCAALVLNGFQEPSSSTNGDDYSHHIVRVLSQSMSDPVKQVRRIARIGLNSHLW